MAANWLTRENLVNGLWLKPDSRINRLRPMAANPFRSEASAIIIFVRFS
jgi:hypothetical protein